MKFGESDDPLVIKPISILTRMFNKGVNDMIQAQPGAFLLQKVRKWKVHEKKRVDSSGSGSDIDSRNEWRWCEKSLKRK